MNQNSYNNKQVIPIAFIASPYHNQDYEWYFNNGASNHVTNHTHKLQDLNDNNDMDSLLVVNGEKLKIVAFG